MARFVVVGNKAINQEAVELVEWQEDTSRTLVYFVDGTRTELEGWHGQAFRQWLGMHVKQWGANATDDYAAAMAEDAMMEDDL
jgi:hypothetical protein